MSTCGLTKIERCNFWQPSAFVDVDAGVRLAVKTIPALAQRDVIIVGIVTVVVIIVIVDVGVGVVTMLRQRRRLSGRCDALIRTDCVDAGS